MNIEMIGAGIIAGATKAATGYLKNRTKEKFDFMHFSMSIVRGGVLGALVMGLGFSEDVALGAIALIGVDEIVVNLWKSGVVHFEQLREYLKKKHGIKI